MMNGLCPVAVASDPTVTVEPQPETVLDSHLLLLKQKRLCDVVFKFEDSTEQIEAHQLYLRERSPVFDLIFRTPEPLATGGKREVDVAGATPARFYEFLEFIYADRFQTTISGALDLLHLALKYKVEPLIKKCQALIKTDVKIREALQVFENASRYGKHELVDKAGDLLAKHMGTLWPTLMGAQEFTLRYLFRRDDLTVKECELFTFLLDWGKNRPGGNESDLTEVLKDLIYHVRYTCMTPNEFTTIVVPSGILPAEEIVQIYSYFGSDPAARSRIALKMNFSVTPRKATLDDQCVWLSSKPTHPTSHVGTQPFKECMAFMAKTCYNASTSVWCEFSTKKPSIKGIFVRWPFRSVQNSTIKDETLNCKVTVKWCIGPVHDKNVEEKISWRLHQRPGGKEEEILVEPPIELINGIKYCITVEDSSQHSKAPAFHPANLRYDPVKFSYRAPDYAIGIKHSPVINFEKWTVELRDIERDSNLTGFGNYRRLQVVAGVRVALV